MTAARRTRIPSTPAGLPRSYPSLPYDVACRREWLLALPQFLLEDRLPRHIDFRVRCRDHSLNWASSCRCPRCSGLTYTLIARYRLSNAKAAGSHTR